MASFLELLALLLLTFGGFHKAQAASQADALASVPTCALGCLIIAIGTSGCGPTDIQCQCTSPKVEANATTCIMAKCSLEDALVAKNATQTHCGAPIRDKKTEFNVVTVVMSTLAVSVVFIRISYKQFYMSDGLGADDWIIVISGVAVIVSAIFNIKLLSNNGLGTDVWTLDPETITAFARGFYINGILYFADVSILKLSLLCFYLRIFPRKGIRRFIWGTIVFNILFGIAFVVTAIFQCTPLTYNWTNWRDKSGGTCIDISTFALVNAALSIAVDLWMLGIPMSQLGTLVLHWKKKVGVAAMFGVGTFITVVSMIRLTSLVKLRNSDNPTWDYTGVSQWSSIEITVGVICACMPSMRMVLVRLFPAIFETIQRHTQAGGTSSKYIRSVKTTDEFEDNMSQKELESGTNINANWGRGDLEAGRTSDMELKPYLGNLQRESEQVGHEEVPTSPIYGWYPDKIGLRR